MDKKQEKTKKKGGLLRWEPPYDRPVDIVFDLVFCLIGCMYFLGFGPFGFTIRIIMALIFTGIFFFTPNLAVFVFAFLFFLCTAHINGALAVVIGVALLLLIGSNHRQACLIILTPMAFTIGTTPVMDCIPIVLWILFIFMAAKYKDFMPAAFYSIYVGFMAAMTGSFGASIYGYAKELAWEPAAFQDYNGFIESIFITKPTAWLLDYSFYGTICFIALTLLAGIGMYKVYTMQKHFAEIKNVWLSDGLKFILFVPVLALYFMVLIVALNLQVPGYLPMIIVGTAIAYAVSRGFMVQAVEVNAVDEQIHEMIESRMSNEDIERYRKEHNLDNQDNQEEQHEDKRSEADR